MATKLQQIARSADGTRTCRELADHHKTTTRYVRRAVKQYGGEIKIVRKQRRDVENGNKLISYWDDGRVAALKKLWSDGLSASQVASKLGGGVTRNAVISKVHRMGLAGRATTVRLSKPPSPAKVASKRAVQPRPFRVWPKVAYEPGPELVVPENERKTIIELEDDDCRWPIGEDQDLHFCNRKRVPGHPWPYCEFHIGRAQRPVYPKRKSPADYVLVDNVEKEKEKA